MRIALLDGDTIVYHAGRPHEVRREWEDGVWTWEADGKAGAESLDTLVEEIRKGMNAERVVVALSDYSTLNWRNKVMPSYKFHRARKPGVGDGRPLLWSALRRHFTEKYETFERPSLEGDDVLGILATHPTLLPKGERVVCSIDKDMNTIPAHHLNFTKEATAFGWEVREVKRAAADYYHMQQTLTGDVTDGYPGCKGVGAVGAKKILDPFMVDGKFDVAGAWLAVVAAYEKAGLSEVEALQNARVARICRATDYDFTNKQIILWNPPKT